MSDAAEAPEQRRPRWRFVFRLRSMMLLVLTVALLLWGRKEWERRQAVDALTGLLPGGVLVGVDGNGVMMDASGNALKQAVRKVKALHGEDLAVSSLQLMLRREPLNRDPRADPAAMRIYQSSKAAMAALEWLGSDAGPAVPELIRILEGSHTTHLRAMAARTLPRIGAHDPRVIEALIRALDYRPRDGDPPSAITSAAAIALMELPRDVDRTATVPTLTRLLKDPDPSSRISAARTLGVIGPDARTAVKALIETLKDESAPVRAEAANALGEIAMDRVDPRPTPLQAELVPRLNPLLMDGDVHVQETAEFVLRRFRSLVEIQGRKQRREALIAAEHAKLRRGLTP
ncbi:HEAT repeat domain-containing protein [Singulisphaera sp. PoT]|uniref:HEAT repeat domain-containing protein n=1 Tax=Singulisphaera sp. PoT TaxID=3411797 RepID=UPI003BF4A690